MRRLLSLILCAASFLAVASDYPGVRAKVVPIAVTGKAYYVQGLAGVASAANEGFNSNAGFVVTDEGVVVIDALGTPPLGAALLGAIRQVTSRPVRRVIVTHYHADHFLGLKPLKDAGAEIWAHGALARLSGVSFAPQVAFLDGRGRDLAPALKGMLLPDFYSAYFEEALVAATAALRASS